MRYKLVLAKFAQTLIQDRLVCYVILLNSLVLFLDAFPSIRQQTQGHLSDLDQICTIYFILEILIKIRLHGWQSFWSSGWNRLDFWLVLLSLPSLFPLFWHNQAFSVILLMRLARLIKFFRLLRFTPNGEHIWTGILRSLKASVSVFLSIFLLNLLFAMGATFLFGHLAPEYFGNPLESWYSLFKVFTVEGWYEVPDALYERTGAAGWTLALRVYYVLAVLIGGVLGFALANAVFVDEMTADNTDYVESLVEQLAAEQASFRAEQRVWMHEIQAQLQSLQQDSANPQDKPNPD